MNVYKDKLQFLPISKRTDINIIRFPDLKRSDLKCHINNEINWKAFVMST